MPQAGAALCYGAWASHRSGFSCCGAQAGGTQALGLQQLQHVGSVVVLQGLSCSQACEIFPDQEYVPGMCSLHQQADSYPLPGKS